MAKPGSPCPVCGELKWSSGDRPCRKCDHIGSRKPRPCEVCGTTYKPTHSLQRACGRACGIVISGRNRCQLDWRTCSCCARWYAKQGGHGYDTCSAECLAQAKAILFPPKVITPKTWRGKELECPTCAATFCVVSPFTAVKVYCSTRCSAKASKLRRRVREADTYGEWRWSDFMRIARKFNYCCAYCGEKPERLDPDHVVPLSKGGPNIIGNLLPTCADCNSDKQAFTLDEWTLRLAARGRQRRTSWAPEDKRYWHLTVLTEPLAHAG